jgi:hypothetical protein
MYQRPVKGDAGFDAFTIAHSLLHRPAGMYGIKPFWKTTSWASLGAWRMSINKPLTFSIQTSGLSSNRLALANF